MSSCGNEVSRWNLRHVRRIAEVLVPVTSPGCAKVSSETPIGGIDQCLHIPGKADSAYSSFSLGSNIPECHIPLYDSDILPLEQLPYLDSGYVRGVFSPCAMHSNLKQIYQDKPVEMSIHNTMGDGKSYGSTSVLGTLYQPPSPVAGFPPHLPHPSSPPAQVDSCKASRNTDQSHYGICFDYSIQAEECSQDTNKTLPLDSPGNYDDCWLSKCKNKSPVIELEDSDIWYPTNQYMTKKNETTISTKPCLNFQDYLKSDSLVPTLNSSHSYNIPEALNSKSSLSPHTNHNAVNDIQENKQYLYACCVHKSPFTEADLPCTMSVSGEKEGQLCGVFKAHKHSGLDQEICESSSPSLKYMDSSLPSLTALGRINTYEDKNHCFSSRDENSRNAGQPLLKQQGRRQKLPSAFQILNGVRKAKPSENNDSPELLTKPKQEEMLAVCSPEQFSKKVESQFQDDSASRKINRKTTPLLYYLSGGKNTDIMSNPNQVQLHEDFDMQSPRSKHSVSAEPIGIPRDSNSCMNDMAASQKTGLILGSPVDEKFKNDYREKLKVAQRKVLRETSFKRKDLQMSLPVRLKQKPSSRPSIQHLRSLSLSGTNEDSRLIPSSKPLENINKQEEPQRPQTNLIGRRKRITKEQKKTSYSEPEKLNQLDDQRDHNPAWRKKNARSRSDEISEQDPMIINNKGLENQGRALSKVELKQIQHNALLQYMERKIGQRPATAHTSTPQKPPLQMRPSNSKKFPEDKISNLSSSKKSQNIDSSCPFSDLGRNLEVPALLSSATSISPDRGSASSSVSEKVNWKMQSAVSEGSCVSRCTATKSLLYLGASVSSRGHGRSKSTPSPMQNFYKSTACPVLTSQDHKYYPFQSSYYVPKKEESGLGNRNENSEENISAENSHCSEMSPECSAFILKETINKDSQLQNERTNQSQMSNASGRIQWQQLQVIHRRAGYCLEDMTACTTILGSLGDKNTGHPSAKGEQNEHDHVFQEQDTELSTAQLKFQEDQRCEDLAVKIVAKDKSLVDILRPHPIRKTALDLMEGLFPVNISISDRSLRIKRRNQSVQENDQIHSDNASDLSHETGHFLEQRADDPTSHIDQILSSSRECLEDPENIISKKKELISSIQLKLQALWDEKELIQSEAKEHAAQGKELESLVQDLCKPNEYERYMMFIGDLEKVVSLLLCLSCRLARVQNAMEKTDENTDAEEKQSLNERHSLLSRQREDAKDLKENLDRRERVVSGILSKYLTESQLQDYRHFVQAKTLLLIEQKDLEEQIKFLEEQLERLEESIPP